MVISPLTLAITTSGEEFDFSSTGERAMALSSLIKAGFPIPDAFVVTTEAWKSFVENTGLDDEIKDLMLGIGELDEEIFREHSTQMMEAVGSREIPEKISAEISSAYIDLCDGEQFGEVTVRSSFVFGDGAGAIPPGLFDSVTEVRGVEEVIEALKRVWASMFNYRTLRYLVRSGSLHKRLHMAVLVQKTVHGEIEGTIHTVDNEESNPDDIVIRAVSTSEKDDGESIVGGELFLVSRDDLSLEQRRIEGAGASGLSEDHACSLARFALRIEEHFGVPQIIDWKLQDDGFFIVDAKPIRSDAEHGGEIIWSRLHWGELFPGIMSPFTRSALIPSLEKSIKKNLNIEGDRHCENTRFFSDINGGLYVNVNAIRDHSPRWAFTYHDLSPTAEVGEEDMSGNNRPGWLDCIAMLIGSIRRIGNQNVEAETLSGRIASNRDKISAGALRGKSDGALHIIIDRFFEQILEPASDLLISSDQTQILCHTALRCALELSGFTDPVAVHMEINTVPGPPRLALDVWRLSRLAESIGGIPEKLSEADNWSYIDPFLGRVDGGVLFGKRLALFLDNHGHHSSSSLEISSTTWRENPEEPATLLRTMIRIGEDIDLASKLEKAAARARETERNRKKNSGFATNLLTATALKNTAQSDALKVKAIDNMHKAVAGLRLLTLEVGRRLESRGEIATQNDVFFLTMSEIKNFLALQIPENKIEDTVEERRENTFNLENMRTDTTVENNNLRNKEEGEITLNGIGASSGTYTGTAVVIKNFSDISNLKPDEVAVLRELVEPLAPVMAISGAAIVETGGFLSGAAMLARSFATPCVVGAHNACNFINTGDIVTIEGNSGKITVQHIIGDEENEL